MEPGTNRKLPSMASKSVTSPSVSGRSSPFIKLRYGESSRPASPVLPRPQFNMNRPSSAARSHLSDYKTTAPDQCSYVISSSESRPSSAMSNRSAPQTIGNAKTKGAENTTVSVRVRPAEFDSSKSPWKCDVLGRSISYAASSSVPPLDFSFDHVFSETITNQTIYDKSVKKLVASVVEGFHGTVFAYGMTGTGKTFSMQGSEHALGIIPLAVRDLFKLTSQDQQLQHVLKLSYLEIYNERIRDLLNNAADESEEIKIRDHPSRGIHAYPLVEITIHSEAEFSELMAQGDSLRQSAATDYNAHSSRSHAVVQILLESKPRNIPPKSLSIVPGRISTLNLIDLAGSERAAADIERRKEGAYINKSLLTLGTVIARLTANSTTGIAHVPFRDSKLTRLLQHALSGLSLVSILATINTDSQFVTETTNTLKFASRAKYIPVKAQKSELLTADVNYFIESLQTEVQQLRTELATSQDTVRSLREVLSTFSGLPQNGPQSLLYKDPRSQLSNINEEEARLDQSNCHVHMQRDVMQEIKNTSDFDTNLATGLRTATFRKNSCPIKDDNNAKIVASFSTEVDRAAAVSTLIPSVTLVKYGFTEHAEPSDQINAMRDQALASSALSKSQKSREETRNLTLQIAHLKRREDNKGLLGGRPGLFGTKALFSPSPDKEITQQLTTTDTDRIHLALISPSIRPPRDGFI